METVMFQLGTVRVLLVEDDEDDYIITRELFAEISGQRFTIEWVKTFEAGLAAMIRNEHDVVLLDYRLGARNGVELLREAIAQGCQAPIILLTGSSQHLVDLEAMRAGADDYLVKAELQARTLERSVRYAVQRKRAAAQAAFEQARLAAFGAEVGLALTRSDPLDSILAHCARVMAQYLNAALARIEIFDPRQQTFEPRATAGSLWENAGSAARLPGVRLDLEALARGVPVLIRDLTADARLSDPEWARREGLVSYAACPLVLEDKLVGLMSIFTRHVLSPQILQEMGSVASNLASCIERKRSEQALDASESKYRSVVESIKEIIFQLDQFGNWTFLNPAWTNVTGFEVSTTLGSLFVEYLHPEDRERDRHVFLELLQGKLDYCRYETRLLTRDGKFRWVEAYLQPTRDAEEGGIGISGTLTDITDRKTAEVQIQKLAAFPQVNPNPVLEFAADGTLSYVNEAARDTAQSLGREEVLSILPPNAAAIVRECIATGAKRLREEVAVEGRTLVWSFFPVVGSQVVHCYGADVTDMLNLEAQFRHAQKLESVGQLAAGVAHDFNNVLTVIQGYSETLLSRCGHDPNTASALRQISEAAQRAAALTRQLLMFSRKQVIQPKLLDLNTVLQNIAKMLLRLLGEHISLETTCARNLARIEADTGMIEQVIMNLAVNARDAMPKGGKLHISTDSVTISEAYASQRPEARPGNFVRLRVADTGCGMDRKTLERIFEPFFSTKEVGKGTGLGLATVYGIVTQHRGWIEVSSEVNVGSTFDIYLPAVTADEQPSHDTAPPFTETARGGTETVLVVEDEAVLRELVREVLKQHHYRVVEAGTGVEALRLWDEFNGEIDLLLTDMVMPEGMSGIDLATQLKRRKPSLRVIYTSGYSAEIMGTEFSQPGAFFLPKPYFPLQLAQLVRQALDSPAPSASPPVAEYAR